MCITPLTLKRNRDEWQTDKTSHTTVTRVVPCGKCFQCLARRRNGWSFRLYHEMLISDSAAFITLTYGNAIGYDGTEFGEDPPKSFNGLDTLKKDDLTKFIKRLRKHEAKNGNTRSLKYYAVGEYGSKNHRPHYHIILFNALNATLLRSDMVAQKIWKKGKIDVAKCNIPTINYVVGYINQGAWVPSADFDDRTPHFSVMSKKLGSSYLTDETFEYHYDRMDASVMHPSGYRIPLPRYFKDQIFTVEEKAELYEINQQMRSMNWQEFVNYDYSKELMINKYKIEQNDKKRKKERAFI